MTTTETTPAPAPTIPEILADLMAYEAEAFDAGEEVDGADLLDAFVDWRRQIVAALAAEAAQLPLAVIRAALSAGMTRLAEVRDDQTSGEADGTYEPGPAIHARLDEDENLIGLAMDAVGGVTPGAVLVPIHVAEFAAEFVERFANEGDGSRYEQATATHKALSAALEGVLVRRTIGIRIEGGLFAGVFSPVTMPDVSLMVFDFDDDCLEPERSFKVEGESRWASVNTYDGADFDVKPIPAFEPVEGEDE